MVAIFSILISCTDTTAAADPEIYNFTVEDYSSDAHRTSFTTFRIFNNTETPEENAFGFRGQAGDYRIGVREASLDKPTAKELKDAKAAITRTLDSNLDINIYLPFHIDGTLFNDGVTADFDIAQSTGLSPNTNYHVYATLANSEGEVYKIFSFKTDEKPNTATALGYNYPIEREYRINYNEPFILFMNINQYTNTLDISHRSANGIGSLDILKCLTLACASNIVNSFHKFNTSAAYELYLVLFYKNIEFNFNLEYFEGSKKNNIGTFNNGFALSNPSNIRVTANTADSISLSWDKVPEATYYKLYTIYPPAAGIVARWGESELIKNITDTNYTLSGQSTRVYNDGREYEFIPIACNAKACSTPLPNVVLAKPKN